MWHVLRKALPGGLTNIIVVMLAQGFMRVFDLPAEQTSAACAAVLATVGLLVLWQACRPFDLWRRIIWIAMAVALVGSFLFLGGFFQLQLGDTRTLLALGTLLLMTPTVFFMVQWVFDMGEKAINRLREKASLV